MKNYLSVIKTLSIFVLLLTALSVARNLVFAALPYESSESGGKAGASWSLPNLIVEDIWLAGECRNPYPLVVKARIRNVGNAPSTKAANLNQILAVGPSEKAYACSRSVGPLAPGASQEIVCNFTSSPAVGMYWFRAVADADLQIIESNERDNSRTEYEFVPAGCIVMDPIRN